jgi:recombinational DNA repair protein RecR
MRCPPLWRSATPQVLVAKHDAQVPDDWGALEALPGVGHKTASVVMAQVHVRPAGRPRQLHCVHLQAELDHCQAAVQLMHAASAHRC